MTTETLTYETPHFLQSLFANDLSLLKFLEAELDLKVTTRDSWVKLQGEPAGVEAGKRTFMQLEKARRRGAEITPHFFRFAIEDARGDGSEPAPGENGSNGSVLHDLTEVKLLGSARKPPIIARTPGQLAYLQAIRKHDVTFGIGPAGTGKTYLAMAAAIDALKAGQVQRIVLTRPAVEAGEALGFLPGDMNEKILPYLRPLYDALYDMVEPEEVERMIERGTVEIAPLAFMRGRTLQKSFIILDEAQNTTQAQMFMFLTRLGEKSKAVITGDPSQVDLKDPRLSGLREAIHVLSHTDGIAFTRFTGGDVVRHRVVQRIISAYNKSRGTGDVPLHQRAATEQPGE